MTVQCGTDELVGSMHMSAMPKIIFVPTYERRKLGEKFSLLTFTLSVIFPKNASIQQLDA